ncbi:MAG: hypothetical protein LBH31_03080, partial [Burkholderiaceae bacterium]|nr:hypothetical protein [Burkholderiaceae bacterium]
ARSCLATRFPYGAALREDALRRVAKAERVVRELGAAEPLRVRAHGDMARLELAPADIPRAAGEWRGELAERLGGLGFRFVTVDLNGYKENL